MTYLLLLKPIYRKIGNSNSLSGGDQIEATIQEDITGKLVSYQAKLNSQPLVINRD